MESRAHNLEQPGNLDQQILLLFKSNFAALEPPGSGWDGLKKRLITAAVSQTKLLPDEIVCDLSNDRCFT